MKTTIKVTMDSAYAEKIKAVAEHSGTTAQNIIREMVESFCNDTGVIDGARK